MPHVRHRLPVNVEAVPLTDVEPHIAHLAVEGHLAVIVASFGLVRIREGNPCRLKGLVLSDGPAVPAVILPHPADVRVRRGFVEVDGYAQDPHVPTMRPVPVLDPLDVILHTRVKGLRRDLVVLRADLQDLLLRPCKLPGVEVVSATAPLRVPLRPIPGVFGVLCGRVGLFVISPLCGLYIAPGTAEPSLVLVTDPPCAIHGRHVRVYVRCHLLPVLFGLALQKCPVVMFAGSLPAVVHHSLHVNHLHCIQYIRGASFASSNNSIPLDASVKCIELSEGPFRGGLDCHYLTP